LLRVTLKSTLKSDMRILGAIGSKNHEEAMNYSSAVRVSAGDFIFLLVYYPVNFLTIKALPISDINSTQEVYYKSRLMPCIYHCHDRHQR